MSAKGGLTAEELVASLRRRQAALPSEIGTFLVFEVCEAVLASGPVVVRADNVRVDTEGGVSLLPGGQPSDEASAARSLHALLTSVLLNARPGLPLPLLRLVENGPSSGQWSLEALRDDLEASLVPLNRHASRRVLSRLLREAAADRVRGSRPSGTRSFDELDAELSDLLGEEPASARASVVAPGVEPDPEVAELAPREPSTVPPPDRSSQWRQSSAASLDIEPASDAPPPASQADIATERHVELGDPWQEPGLREDSRSRLGLWLGLGLVGLAVGLVAAVVVLRPDVLARLRGEEVSTAPPPDPLVQAAQPGVEGGELVLEVEPAGAQVLLRVGTAPVEVKGVPVGQAQEFVATAEGRAPSRALIAADDPWEETSEGPFFELAMQTRPLPEGKSPSLGDSLLPMEPTTARRHDGRVRVVTAPRGAEVYRVVGFAPEVRIRNLDTEQERSLLVYRDGYTPETVHIRPQDWPVGPEPVLRERVKLKR